MADDRVFAEPLGGFGEFSLTVLDPRSQAELVHTWVTQPENRFWGMASYTQHQVRDVYDPLGEHYDVRAGDVGVHVLLAPDGRGSSQLVELIARALLRFVFAEPSHTRIVVEPDVRNRAALLRLRRSGFALGPEAELADKRARLAFLTREVFERAGQPGPATDG